MNPPTPTRGSQVCIDFPAQQEASVEGNSRAFPLTDYGQPNRYRCPARIRFHPMCIPRGRRRLRQDPHLLPGSVKWSARERLQSSKPHHQRRSRDRHFAYTHENEYSRCCRHTRTHRTHSAATRQPSSHRIDRASARSAFRLPIYRNPLHRIFRS